MKVYLEFRSPKHHTLYDELINFPPEGVEYIVSSGNIYSTRKYRAFNYVYNKLLRNIAPNIGNIYHRLKKENTDVDLIHICNTFTPRNSPWIMDIENVGSFTGHDKQIFQSQKSTIEKTLSSKQCKKVMPWTNAGKRTLERFLDTKEFEEKIEIVKPAIRPMPAVEKQKHDKIRLLFMGSINNPNTFIDKGGMYALECFDKLSKKYDIELVIRSAIPREIKGKYYHKDIIYADNPLPKKQILDLYANSDISLIPGHNYALMATLESMAFGLPIVAINGWSMADFVEHGISGYLVKPSKNILVEESLPIDWTPGFWEWRDKVDETVLDNMVKFISVLIEDGKLRGRLGKNAMSRIEEGDLSIKKRNEKLRKIYDEAIME